MSGIDLGVWITILGVVTGAYIVVYKKLDEQDKKIKAVEDCAEDKIGELAVEFRFFKEQEHDFHTKVLQRLTAIETHLKGGLNPGPKRR